MDIAYLPLRVVNGFNNQPTLSFGGAVNVNVIVQKDLVWQQEGGLITATTLRVCIGEGYYDVSINEQGQFFVGGSYVNQFTLISMGYPFTLPMGFNIPNIGAVATPGTFVPFNPQTAETTVYAYEITAPTPEFTNAPGWKPGWKVLDPNNPVTEVGIVGSTLDQQQVSIFGGNISVDQSAFGVSIETRVDSSNLPGYDAYLEPIPSGGQQVDIYIRISPKFSYNGFDIPNSNPFNYTPGGGRRSGIVKKTPLPPINNGPGNGRPVVGIPGGGGAPTTPDYVAIEVNPDPIAHDDTDVGTFKTKSFTVKNVGTVDVEVDSIINTHPDNIFTFGMNSPIAIPFTIEPTEEFGGTAYFIPEDDIIYTEIGYVKNGATILRRFSITGTGTLSGNPGDTPLRKIALRGDTVTSGDVNFLEATIGEPPVNGIIQAINAGNLPITLNSVSLGGSGVFTTGGVTSGFVLDIGAKEDILVSFAPVGVQEYLGTFTLNSNAQASDQAGFNPSTGAITCNLRGTGTTLEPITRIMSFNVQNNGTFEDALAGGSATVELDATITNIGNATLGITQFQVQSPFSLELDAFGTYTIGDLEFYSLDQRLEILPNATSPVFTIKFTPPTATNFVDDVLVVSNKTIGPEAFEVRGTGTFDTPVEPEEPDVPVTPDDEPPPGQEFDPGTVPSSALDGNGSTCIPKECDVVYVYEYSSNGEIVT
jgi:hypothetical protein